MSTFSQSSLPILPGLRSFRCYRAAIELATLVFALPVTGETRDQMHRAMGSVVRNLAEGAGARTPAMQRRHYDYSRASLWEVTSDLDLLVACGRTPDDIERMAELACDVDAMLAGLQRRRK